MTNNVKDFISDSYRIALANEKITQLQSSKNLGIIASYSSIVYHGETTRKLPDAVWQRMFEWVDSDKKLSEVKYPALPVEPRKEFGRKKREQKEHVPHYSAGGGECGPTGKLHSLDDMIDCVYKGIKFAMKYNIPERRWKAVIKELYYSKSEDE